MAAADAADLVSVRQDRRRTLPGDRLPRQSPDPVAGAGGARESALRDFIVARRTQAFLILAFYLGPWLAWATLPRTHRLHLLLSAVGDDRIACARLRADGRAARPAALGAVGVRRGRIAWLSCDVADLGRGAGNVDADVSTADDLQELDLTTGSMLVMPGHSRPKDGVASLAYVPGIHVFPLRGTARRGWPGRARP